MGHKHEQIGCSLIFIGGPMATVYPAWANGCFAPLLEAADDNGAAGMPYLHAVTVSFENPESG